MRNCSCGNAIEDGDALCARCGALHELGLTAGASLDAVKSAYKMLVKVWHPDRFQNDEKLGQAAQARLMAINAAFAYLTSGGYKGGGKYKAEAGKEQASQRDAEWTGAAPESSAKERARAARPGRAKRRAESRSWGTGFGLGLVFRLLVLVVVLGAAAFVYTVADSYLAADPTMSKYYLQTKSRVKGDFENARQRMWEESKEKLHGFFGGNPGTAPMPAPVVNEPVASAPAKEAAGGASSEGHMVDEKPQTPLRLMPYVTVGITRDEVESAQGATTSATKDKLIYGASELDLKDGKVVGWRIDSRSPLRVKLWPEGPVDTSLRVFAVGSTKDEVLAVQGTPSSFSADRFDYGSSVVYFREGRVLVWKDGSVRLRVER